MLAVAPAFAAGPPQRIAAVGWPAAQALLALGVPPLGVTEIRRYEQLVIEPALPSSTLELGLRFEPNLEQLQALAPDLILADASAGGILPRLRQIAPVSLYAWRGPQGVALPQARTGLRMLAGAIGRDAAGEACLAELDATLARARDQLRPISGRHVFLVAEVLQQRMLMLGGGSLFQSVLDAIGLRNAWTGPTSAFGHALVSLDELAAAPDARLILTGRQGRDWQDLAGDPILRHLPFVREGRVTVLPATLFYGGVPSATRLAQLLMQHLDITSV
nr:ABC transporter substrate-binding protein [Plastoroseomonas hellenica]